MVSAPTVLHPPLQCYIRLYNVTFTHTLHCMSPYRYPYFGLHLAVKTVGASSDFLQTLRCLSPRTLALFERNEFAKFLAKTSKGLLRKSRVLRPVFICKVASPNYTIATGPTSYKLGKIGGHYRGSAATFSTNLGHKYFCFTSSLNKKTGIHVCYALLFLTANI